MRRVLQNVLFSAKYYAITENSSRRWCSQAVRDKGSSALSSYCQRTHHCGELNGSHVGQQVELSGWLQSQRLDLFLILRDAHGTTQVTIPQDERTRNNLGKCTRESIVRIRGVVKPRPEGQINKKMVTGDIEVIASDIEVLNTARNDLPFQIQDFHKVTEALRMRYRYLDLRNAEIQRNLRIRSQMVMKMREFLCNQNGFVEVETPTLFRKTPGGAREFVVPTHHKGKYYSLPQSPQQFKQLLMVGGIDRYMQIARCYRDETANPDRQPEFTQVDLEMSFVTPSDIRTLVEGMLGACWPAAKGQQLTTPFEVMTFERAMAEYGVDKPDTRFDMKVHDVTSDMAGCDSQHAAILQAVSNSPRSAVKAVNFKQAANFLSNKEIEGIKAQTKVDGVWNAAIKVKKESDLVNLANFGAHASSALGGSLRLEVGDLLLVAAGRTLEASGVVGKQRVQVANLLESKGQDIRGDKNKLNFLWVEDFPLFMPKEDGTEGLESAHHPFTAPHPEDLDLIYSAPEKVRGLHYDLVLNGAEIGGGSIRIHNAQLQRYVLQNVLKEDPDPLEHLLEALDCGCPPHGGIALGLDRLLAIVCGATSIRDVIAFPKSIDGKDSMSKAPAAISEEDRIYYHLPQEHS